MNNRTQTQNDMHAMYAELRRTDKAADRVAVAFFSIMGFCTVAITIFSFIKG